MGTGTVAPAANANWYKDADNNAGIEKTAGVWVGNDDEAKTATWVGNMDGDRACVTDVCEVNFRVQNNACVACPEGLTNIAGDKATGADTFCNHDNKNGRYNVDRGKTWRNEHVLLGTACAVNERVVEHACVACETGKTRPAGDPTDGPDTFCYATEVAPTAAVTAEGNGNDKHLCGINEYVEGHKCMPCAKYYWNEAGDDRHLHDTACKKVMCKKNWYVDASDASNHVCKPCNTETHTDTYKDHKDFFTSAEAWVGGDATHCHH